MPQSLSQINQGYEASQLASLRRNSDLRPRLQMRVTFALDTAATAQNPARFPEAFTGYFVEQATDNNTYAQISFTSPEQSNISNYVTVRAGDSADCGQEVKGAYLTWPAQAGKTITFVFFLGVAFHPGQALVNIEGGIAVSTGLSMTPVAAVTVSNVASQVLAADATRKKTTLSNLSGATVYISGTANVVGAAGGAGTLIGIPIPVGGHFEVQNTGAIYGITDSGSALLAINKES